MKFPAQIWRRGGCLLTFRGMQIPRDALNTLEVTGGTRSSLHVPEDGPSTSAYSVEDSRNSVVLSLRLKKGKVRSAHHTVHTVTRFPVPVCHRPEVLKDQEQEMT